jgi:integrase
MSVRKRNTSKGESEFYHYKFMSGGKYYTGVCKGCTKKKDALAYEQGVKDKVNELSKQKNVKALVENFRSELTGGNDILLDNAFDLFLKKPRKKTLSGSNLKHKTSCWLDFVEYMHHHYPEVKKLADVCRPHAEEYIQYIRDNGRFNKKIIYKSGSKTKTYERKESFSNRTCNAFQLVLTEVFDKLFSDAGLLENPFTGIPKLNNESESREAFTQHELKNISEKADDFIRSIFTIGIATALREGDICTLKWDEIDLDNNIIKRQTTKTKRVVEIPILPPLKTFLVEQKQKNEESKYVLPEHAEMYNKNQSGITWRVKKFLESIGIETTKKVPGRTRAISIKDVHSLRHTFCYYAGVYGIPFLVVKDIVGHVSPQMTELYQRHADNRMKREKLMQMPDLMGLPQAESNETELQEPPIEPERAQLHKLVDELPLDVVKVILEQLQSPKRLKRPLPKLKNPRQEE